MLNTMGFIWLIIEVHICFPFWKQIATLKTVNFLPNQHSKIGYLNLTVKEFIILHCLYTKPRVTGWNTESKL